MASTSTSRLDLRLLWRGHGMEIVSTTWRRDRHPARSEAHVGQASVEFMLTGSFRKETGRDAVVGDANNAVVFQPGERFCVDHPAGASNTGVTIRFEPTFCRDTSIFERGSWTVPASAWAQVNALAAELGRPTSHDVPDVEARVVALLAHWLSTREPSRTTERRSERDRVRCAQSHLNDVLDRPVSLRELGALVDWSPWHLVRAFQRHTGVSPYRYHLRLRLRAAMCEMMRGRAELTAIALRAGFSSHSHFTQAFRREFGAPPSAMMRSLRADG